MVFDAAPSQSHENGGINEGGFSHLDWLSFGITTAAVLSIYLLTLTPQVTLRFSGIFSVGAMYAGVPHPPGYPLATLYGWVFVKLLPFSNIAWRVAVSSAVAGALACGLIALMVSRSGASLTRDVAGLAVVAGRQVALLRLVAGIAAGAIFGSNGAFWGKAVIADVWPLSILLICSVICLFFHWSLTPEKRRYLYGACFVYGLAVTNSQFLLVAVPALPFLALASNRDIARDLCLGIIVIILAMLIEKSFGLFAWLEELRYANPASLSPLYMIVAVVALGIAIGLIVITRRIFSTWRTMIVCAILFILGLAPYLYVPIASMTNPPVNWAYPRTIGGFSHLLTRGQYERIQPTNDPVKFAGQLTAYGKVTAKEFGWPHLLLIIPVLAFFRRLPHRDRHWIGALLATYLCLVFLTLGVLNPTDFREIKWFFALSYIPLAVLVGCGMMILGRMQLSRNAMTSV